MGANHSDRIHELLGQGVEVVRATILETSGSTPRHSGSSIAVASNGELLGTIGGGRLEYTVINDAKRLFGGNGYEATRHYSLTVGGVDSLGMVCGGEATVRLELFNGDHPYTAPEAEDDRDRLFIFGAGHVGTALEPIARSIDFRVTMVDVREEFANEARFPQAEAVLAVDSYAHAFESIETDDASYIVIVTHEHVGDYDVLKQALRQPCAYVGMIGSRRKIGILFGKLADEGFSKEEIASVHAPIGEDISAETPGEIAISIAAELVRVRADRRS